MDSEYDDSLLERLNRGEQDVYDDVFKTYYSKLIGLARRRLAVAVRSGWRCKVAARSSQAVGADQEALPRQGCAPASGPA